MQMNKKTLKMLFISGIIFGIVLFICLFIVKINSNLKEEDYFRDYDVNEYIPTYVSQEDLAKIYLNDYLYNMRYNIKEAYDSLDPEYREKKFGSIENYRNYIQPFIEKAISAKKYSKEYKKGYNFYKIYDEQGNIYIFKTKGIMQYSLFLDENTVEIR